MENTNFAEEFEGTEALENEQVATDAPEVVKAPKERETYEFKILYEEQMQWL